MLQVHHLTLDLILNHVNKSQLGNDALAPAYIRQTMMYTQYTCVST